MVFPSKLYGVHIRKFVDVAYSHPGPSGIPDRKFPGILEISNCNFFLEFDSSVTGALN